LPHWIFRARMQPILQKKEKGICVRIRLKDREKRKQRMYLNAKVFRWCKRYLATLLF
jgi:hypothetical protein